MWPYWVMFIVPALVALQETGSRLAVRDGKVRVRWDGFAVVALFLLTLLIGLRYEVGGDWGAYMRQFAEADGLPLSAALTLTDPGYMLLNWTSSNLGLDIYGVNLVCGAIFAVGLVHFCLSLPRPWLALTVATPYLVIVVAMGYTRQGVALGLSMLGLVALKRKSTFWFVFWGLLGATFHKTAVLLLPIAALAGSRNWVWRGALAMGTSLAGYQLLLQDSFDSMYSNYVGSDVQSEGAMIRLLMNAVPAVILLFWSKRFPFAPAERSLWRWFAIISLGMLAALLVVPSASTALDRMALYMLPLQVAVFAHVPRVFSSRTGSNAKVICLAIIGYYAAVLLVWSTYGVNSLYWIPYRLFPFADL